MQLGSLCRNSSPAWCGRHFSAFSVKDENGVGKTIFKYTLPFSEAQDAILVEKLGLSAEERSTYYQTLVQGIRRHIAITNKLKDSGTRSILFCESVEQEADTETGRNNIYIQTCGVQPIQQVLLRDKINLLTLLDVFIRLTIIVRDIGQANVHHRAISMDEVFIDDEGKIRLGGFHNGSSPEHEQIIPYLPDAPRHLPAQLLQGMSGSVAEDMQTVSMMLFNILAGLPWDTQWSRLPTISPAYAPEGLEQILMFGMKCTDNECNRFRRLLLDYRKQISKTMLSTLQVPIVTPYSKIYNYG